MFAACVCYRDLMEVSARTKQLLPWLVAVAFFMESLDTTILNTAVPSIAEALKVPEVKTRIEGLGMDLAGLSPADSAAFFARDQELWGRIIKAAGITLD